MKRFASVLASSLLVSSLLALPAYAAVTPGHWVNSGTKFQLSDGSLAQNQWIEDEEGDFYYVGADGTRVTGWQTIPTAAGDASYDYYFDKSSGELYVNRYTPTGYYVNDDGVKIPERYLMGSEASFIEQKKQEEASKAASHISETPHQSTETEQQTQSETEAAEESSAAEQQAQSETEAVEESSAAAEAVADNQQTSEAAAADTDATEAAETETAAATEAADAAAAQEEQLSVEFFNMLNGRRQAAGLPAFEQDPDLTKAAQLRAAEIAGYSEADVAADAGVYYDRPQKHDFGGIQTASSVTAVAQDAILSFTNQNYGILITELPVWQAETIEDALHQLLDKNEGFLLDATYGFNRMGVGCREQNGKLSFSVFIGTREIN